MRRRPPRSTLMPSTTLFRSHDNLPTRLRHGALLGNGDRITLGRDLHRVAFVNQEDAAVVPPELSGGAGRDRKSTRLNSSHANISYAVFCLKIKILASSTCPL